MRKLLSVRGIKFFFVFLLFLSFIDTRAQNISGIINTYASVTAIDSSSCPVNITLSSAAGYNVGDTVVIIQMKGATIDVTNVSTFGNVLNYGDAGNYEFGIISKITGSVVGLKYRLFRSYDPTGLVQLIRVPYYNSPTVTGTLTAPAWNGSTGGVLVLQSPGTITLNANIDVSGLGFNGGSTSVNFYNGTCVSNYFSGSSNNGQKGEGIVDDGVAYDYAKGKLANGAGGGNQVNSSGGGGGNYGTGGRGGDDLNDCPSGATGGDGGINLIYSSAANKIFLGGGGGGGQQNDNVGTPGVNGAGIIIIKANTIVGNNQTVRADGQTQTTTIGGQGDGVGGGGGGGAVLISAPIYTGTLNVSAVGGGGGNTPWNTISPGGGGGGGGVLWYSGAALPGNINTFLTGGAAGIETADGNAHTNGSVAGQPGGTLNKLQLPQSTNTSNMGSSSAGPNQLVCQGSVAPLTASGGINYTWSPAAYLSSTTGANVIASPTTIGVYNYTVSVTSANGCYSYAGVAVTVVTSLTANAGSDMTICSGTNLTLNGSGGQSYNWSPSTGLINPTNYTTTFTITASGTYNYTLTASSGSCTPSTDGIMITVNPNPLPTLSGFSNATVCLGNSTSITVTGATSYTWSPSKGLNTVTGQTVIASPTVSTPYSVTGSDNNGCNRTSTVLISVSVNPLPTLIVSPASITLCTGNSTMLSAIGTSAATPISYLWQPGTGLSNPAVPVVTASPTATMSYTVTGTDQNGCYKMATTNISLVSLPIISVSGNETICSGNRATLTASGATTYTWLPVTVPANGQTVTTSPISSTITYTVTGKDQNGCTNTANIEITPSAIIATSDNATIDYGQTVVVSISGNGTKYSWTPSTSLSCNSCSSTIASPTVTTGYQIIVTNDNGCSVIDSVIVYVIKNCGGDIFIPDAFSPNGDTYNDVLYLKSKSERCILYVTFEIFDRWGNKVFETSDPNQGWDGTYKGRKMEPAVFVYALQVVSMDGSTINRKGNISLMK